MNYSNLDISKFTYTKMLKELTGSEKTMYKKSDKASREKLSGAAKIVRLMALKKIKVFMNQLIKGSKEDKLLYKVLSLEREYIRVKEKEDLRIEIERVSGLPAAGIYTLAETGDILQVSRERVRRIEASAEKTLRHPEVARSLRLYRES